MERDELGHGLFAPCSARFDPARGGRVQPRASGPRQGLVRDLADEDVPEHVAVRPARPDEVLVDERAADLVGAAGEVGRDRLHAGRPERPAEHRADLDEPSLVLREAVEAREDRRLHRIGQRVERAAALHERADELAGVEGVALGPRDDALDDLGLLRLEEVLDELRDGAVGERLE